MNVALSSLSAYESVIRSSEILGGIVSSRTSHICRLYIQQCFGLFGILMYGAVSRFEEALVFSFAHCSYTRNICHVWEIKILLHISNLYISISEGSLNQFLFISYSSCSSKDTKHSFDLFQGFTLTVQSIETCSRLQRLSCTNFVNCINILLDFFSTC